MNTRNCIRMIVPLALLGAAVVALPAEAQDELFVVNNSNNSVTVYGRTASGDTAPLRTLSGALTGLNSPDGVAVDAVNNELFVVNFNPPSITVYPRTWSVSNTPPTRTLSGAATGLTNPIGVALDLTNNEMIIADQGGNSVAVYPRTWSLSNTPPTRTLVGAATGLNNPVGVAVDLTNNELFVANLSPSSVTVYPRTWSLSNTPPTRTLSGAATELNFPEGLALDLTNNELFVANFFGTPSPTVTVYPRTWSLSNTPPTRTLAGAATGLTSPNGIALDLTNNELFVSNSASPYSVTVFPRTWSLSNTPPTRTLTGAVNTGLSSPTGLAVTAGAPTPTSAVPTLSEWAEIGMLVLLVLVGILALRRRPALASRQT